MDNKTINEYGDKRIATASGHGVDVASQRADDLDQFALEHIMGLAKQQPVHALEIGCGHGGQAIRMAVAGAQVIATDIEDYSQVIDANIANAQFGHGGACSFVHASIEVLPQFSAWPKFDVVVCQRMIHYLRYPEAVHSLSALRQLGKKGTKLFISASGINSELGNEYLGQDQELADRFQPLDALMAEKHSIYPSVCLYSPSDIEQLLLNAGWVPISIFKSSFGNIKAVAQLADS